MPSRFVASGADAYELQMGRWSRRLARPFLDFTGFKPGGDVADLGCGTGNLSIAMLEGGARSVAALDYDHDFVAATRARTDDARLDVRQGDAAELPYADRSFDFALSMLVLHFVSDPVKAIGEMRRVLRPGGIAAATVWDTYGGMPSVRMFWDTASAIEPSAGARRIAQAVKPMTRQGELAAAMRDAGLIDVSETLLAIRMDFVSFEDYWLPTTRSHGNTAAFLATLNADTRARIESAVREAYLLGGPDGPRSFVSVAWAARGRKA